MEQRTTVALDDETLRAARQLALRFDCSLAEAIRLAVVRHRDAVAGVSTARREARRRALEQLFELFEGHDAEGEVGRLNQSVTDF